MAIGPTLDPQKEFQQTGKKQPTKVVHTEHNEHVISPEAAKFSVKTDEGFGDKVAIAGFSESNFGIFASSRTGTGLFATGGEAAAGFDGHVNISGDCNVSGKHKIGGDLHTDGSHFVGGDIQMAGADYAEDFDVAESTATPGTVMVLDDAGRLRTSTREYDRRVAGVLSGAGGFTPGIVLDRQGETAGRRPLALMGKVWCRVDASHGAIAVGDFLTTSATPGHAMKAADPQRAYGAVIGKALKPLASGRGLVPILITLQ